MTGAPFPYESYPSPGPTAPPSPQHRTGDIVVTVVELTVLALGALLVTVLVAFVGFLVEASDSISSSDSGDSSGTGGLIALVLVPTWGLWLAAVVVSTVLMVAKKLAFWVPIVAFAVWAVVALVIANAV